MKYLAKTFSKGQMAKVLGVSLSGYYDFAKRLPSARTLENRKLLKHIHHIHEQSYQTYGSPRIHAALKDLGYSCSRQRVARLMKVHQIQAKMVKRKNYKKPNTHSADYQDLLYRNYTVNQPKTGWVADITYIKVNQKWGYLAVILDLFSRKIVGMNLDSHMKAGLVLNALNQALVMRKPAHGLIHHSDRDSQYTAHDLAKVAHHKGISLSYGRCTYDNALMESFFHTLKTEHVYFKKYKTLEEARTDIFQYIFAFYNTKRKHSTLNYKSPLQKENEYEKVMNSYV
jgi:transposase InsO family protein